MTITHPFHPLRNQQVEIIFIRRGHDPDLIVRLPDGFHAAVAMSATDYATSSVPDLPLGPLPLLDLEGLYQMVQLVDRLKREGRYPGVGHDEPCPPAGRGYD